MKSIAAVLSLILVSSNAFSPPFATRAVGKPVAKKEVAKPAAKVVAKPVAKAVVKPVAKVVAKPVAKVVAKPAAKVVAKVAPKPVAKVVAKAAPKPAAKPVVKKVVLAKPALKLPSLTGKVPPKPKISLAAPSTQRAKKLVNFVYDDGLTELERRQRGTPTATFLTGSAKSQVDKSAIRTDLTVGEEYFFSPYDTTILFVFSFVLVSLIIKAGSP
jgi:hypothetical protein